MSNNDFATQGTAGKFLSKEEELELGRIIQRHFKAKDELELGENLTPERVSELEGLVQEGKDAVEQLVKANMGLVYERAKIFKRNYPRAPEEEDLVQEGMTGLMTAVQKYDPERGNKFSTVAYFWIAQAVGRGVNKTGRLVRLPENRINEYSRITKIMNDANAENLSPAEIDQLVMDELGLSKKDLRNIMNAASTPASLNKVVATESGSTKELLDFVSEQHPTVSSEQALVNKEMREILENCITSLSPVHEEIIRASFNLSNSVDAETPEQLRKRRDIPPFRFKRMQTEALQHLRESFSSHGYTFEDFAASQ